MADCIKTMGSFNRVYLPRCNFVIVVTSSERFILPLFTPVHFSNQSRPSVLTFLSRVPTTLPRKQFEKIIRKFFTTKRTFFSRFSTVATRFYARLPSSLGESEEVLLLRSEVAAFYVLSCPVMKKLLHFFSNG